MEMNIDELRPHASRIHFTKTSASQINAIRRALLSDVPKMAIDDVEFHLGPIRDEATGKDYDSSTSLFDENVALRMGLLPIPTDLKQFRFKDKCVCKGEGCANCQIVYSIDKKGPCTVYSSDVVPMGDTKLTISEPNIPIVRLGSDQALLVYATAVMGTARTHAKWQVAQSAGLGYQPHVSVARAKECSDGCLKKIPTLCPGKVFSWTDGKLKVVNENGCVFCEACEKSCSHGSIKVEGDPTDIHFDFETDSSMTAREALRFALNDLRRRLEELRDAVVSIG
ncbi:MAG: DNA-directed RNA polymerase subunit D [Euryarchaeota archaeon]|nr:DNA-directed RNA polymerase subunit D [Euryarchaeota archaeon]MDE1837876.1 DNA-directed RNA polymerase subunit D [Euryarchaeota archaeon]MDE1881653.1 DNA-directed RNA polymerase subunit D [Euryarchaeota archaeon]MDE2046222.1 DNA-directed RNA polymerase subunit D [Thermoplasmata archaeon]